MLSQQIHALRLAKKMSQVELAKELGVSKQSVSNWENDNILPSIEMLERLADVFSVSTDYLLSRSRDETIDVSGLPADVVASIRQIVKALQTSNSAK